MSRNSLLVVVAAFVMFGVLGWVWGMPKPAASGIAVAPLPLVDAPPLADPPVAASSLPSSPAATISPASVVADEWLLDVGTSAGIPLRALEAYASASIAQDAATPGCGLGWNTLAAIGSIESDHGTHDGAGIAASGAPVGKILGPVLDGGSFAAIRDTDDGTLDGNTEWDRAVGPMQFIPSTWASYAADGNGDGVSDPNQIDDAARAAAAYLCAAGGDLSTADGWNAAIGAYNRDAVYVESVRTLANVYAGAAQ